MTSPALKVDPHATLWVTDAELIRRSGIPEKRARALIQKWDEMGGRFSGFPQKKKEVGDRRHWPSVEAYFARIGGPTMAAPQPQERRHG
jgi:hypothetical protein